MAPSILPRETCHPIRRDRKNDGATRVWPKAMFHRSLGHRPSTLYLNYFWVQPFEFDSGVLGGELPVGGLAVLVASVFPCRYFLDQSLG